MEALARRRYAFPLLFAVLALAAKAAGAAEVRERAPVVAATLYPEGAEVVRMLRLELEPGRHDVVIEGLPEALDPAAIRISVKPGDLVDLRGFTTRLRPAAEYVGPRERELEAEIERLADEIRLRDDRIRAARIQLRLVERIGEAAADLATKELAAGQPEPGAWRKSWEAVGSGAIEILEVMRQNEREKRELERRLEAKRRELEEIRTGARASRELILDLEIEETATVSVELRHMLERAGWSPLYEARLHSRRGELTFERRARVWQKTGEDWRGIALRLATTRPRQTVSPPRLDPWFVDIVEPEVAARERALARKVPEGTVALAEPEPSPAPDIMREADEFHTVFTVSKPVDLLADGSRRMVTLARDKFPAELLVTVTPKIDPSPYLTASFLYDEPDPVLPGPVRLVRDGAYVGESWLDFVVPGEKVRLGFGRDDKVVIEHRLVTDFKSSEGIVGRYRRIERRWEIRVRNRHKRALPIVVFDRLPVPKDERITVELLEDGTPPTERDVDGRPGVLGWRYDYEPGEERTIRFGFAVTFPTDLKVGGLQR